MNKEQINEALDWRYATKQFDPSHKITEADWKTLEKALVSAPSSFGIQPWKFLVVQNPKLLANLKNISWNQSQVTDASHYVVFLYKEKTDVAHIDKYIRRISEVRRVPVEALAGYRNMMVENLTQGPRVETISFWAQKQAYIAMGFLLETASLLKIDACPMEGLDTKAYDEILGLEGSGWKTVASVALGYRHPDDKYAQAKKVRFSTEDVVEYVR